MERLGRLPRRESVHRPLDAALDVRLAVETGFPLDLIVRTPAEVRRRLALGDFFLREIVDKGIVLYEGAHG